MVSRMEMKRYVPENYNCRSRHTRWFPQNKERYVPYIDTEETESKSQKVGGPYMSPLESIHAMMQSIGYSERRRLGQKWGDSTY